MFSCAWRTLVLGFDDTLSRFTSPSRHPRIRPFIVRALSAIAEFPSDLVVVHSADRLQFLRLALGSVRAHLIAEDGWEELTMDGYKTVHQLPTSTQRRLARAARAAEECGWNAYLIRRRCSILLRTRGLPPGQGSLIRELGLQLWSSRFEGDGLSARSTASGIELRAIQHSVRGAVDALRRPFGVEQRLIQVKIADDTADGGSGDGVDWSSDPAEDGAMHARLRGKRAFQRFLDEWLTRREAGSSQALRS